MEANARVNHLPWVTRLIDSFARTGNQTCLFAKPIFLTTLLHGLPCWVSTYTFIFKKCSMVILRGIK